MQISKRLEQLERRRLPKLPVVVRWDSPERGQLDIRTREPVEPTAKVRVVAYLGTREQWDML